MQDGVDRLAVCESIVDKTDVPACCGGVELEVRDWRDVVWIVKGDETMNTSRSGSEGVKWRGRSDGRGDGWGEGGGEGIMSAPFAQLNYDQGAKEEKRVLHVKPVTINDNVQHNWGRTVLAYPPL